jgi:two-component system, NarL family, response regulator LiaR
MKKQTKISLLIADDHAIVRQGLRSFLELQEDITVVGEAVNGKQAVEFAAKLKPNVILMDLMMPEVDGISATKEISALNLGCKIIALTSFLEEENVVPAIQAGAAGYLLKDVSPNELVEAIRAVQRGEARLNDSVTRKLMEKVSQQSFQSEQSGEHLTERETEVLKLVAQGKNNRQIAGELVISEKTVKTHISSLLGKLHQDDRTQLAVYAIKNKLA